MKKVFSDKTYRIIEVDDKLYCGKDSFKERKSDYIIELFDKDYFKDKTILDLGCASGSILFKIKNDIKLGVGVDVDEKKLNIGKIVAAENNITNVLFIEQRLEEYLKNTEENPDCIFLLNILHHLQNPEDVLNLTCEISNDLICIEVPEIGFYNSYERDHGKEVKTKNLDLDVIISFLKQRNYDMIIKEESKNQESFIGPKRFVCIFKKKNKF